MNRKLMIFTIFLMLGLAFAFQPARVQAQAETPGANNPTQTPVPLPQGSITGKIINQNNPAREVGELEVMLHILDQDQNELGMLHGQSTTDGNFTITEVPFQVGLGYTAAVVFEETTYYSPMLWAEAEITEANVEVPVYESTPDLAAVRVEQMHVLFDFAQDGMEVKELFALSNLGERTVRAGQNIPGNSEVKASVLFPLPENADFINFEPQDNTRFIKYAGGFADLAPIQPGEMVNMLIAGFLLPYTDPQTFTFQTTLPVQSVDFVLPHTSGMTLSAEGLGEPEKVEGQDGQIYDLYPLEAIPAGTSLVLTFTGEPNIPTNGTVIPVETSPTPSKLPITVGLGILGVALAAGGVYGWVRSTKRSADGVDGEEEAGEAAEEEDAPGFDALLAQIARLDEQYEQGGLDEKEYHSRRESLMAQAKTALAENSET
ncbi:MAG: hypothetical protein ACYC36_04450 [Bellilinea sp.]